MLALLFIPCRGWVHVCMLNLLIKTCGVCLCDSCFGGILWRSKKCTLIEGWNHAFAKKFFTLCSVMMQYLLLTLQAHSSLHYWTHFFKVLIHSPSMNSFGNPLSLSLCHESLLCTLIQNLHVVCVGISGRSLCIVTESTACCSLLWCMAVNGIAWRFKKGGKILQVALRGCAHGSM